MDTSDALPFIEALACGLDPVTGDVLPADSPLHHPQVIRALFTATRLIESQCVSAPADTNTSRPTRAGEPWDEDEDRRLTHAFHAGEPFARIADTHQRSRGAIVSRLVRLGHIQRKSSRNTETPCPSQDTEHPDDKWWRKERPQAGKPWTPEEDADIKSYADTGLAISEIARRMRRGDHGVDVRLSKLGLHSESLCGSDSEELPY